MINNISIGIIIDDKVLLHISKYLCLERMSFFFFFVIFMKKKNSLLIAKQFKMQKEKKMSHSIHI